MHLRGSGKGFIHPEHKIVYRPVELKEMLITVGFIILVEYGICEMPNTIAKGDFCYEGFI